MAYFEERKSEQKCSETTMKLLPTSLRALNTEAISLGLLGTNPDLTQPRAKLINYMYNSKKIKRSYNHSSIVLVGSVGVGKSSTVNHLLKTGEGTEVAKTNETGSETRTTQEYIIYADEPEYEVKGLSLGVVDSPGFQNTEGHAQDACNFVSIKKFYETHPKLSGCYPNLIFLAVKATDRRIKGVNSDLSKSLSFLKLLGIVDPKKPNVVAILTFCCSIPYFNKEKWSEKMEKQTSVIQNVILDILEVTAPVVLLENDYGEDGYNLNVHDDYTCLPNGVLQPRNLYKACAAVLIKNKDDLGLLILNSVFKARRKEPPEIGHKIEAKDASEFELNSEEEEFVDSIEDAYY